MTAAQYHRRGPDPGEIAYVILFVVLCGILFAGCAAPQPVARVETVEVLVPVIEPCPAPPEALRPALPLAALDSTSTPADVLRAYVSSAWLLAGYAEELETILGAYRPDTTTTE